MFFLPVTVVGGASMAIGIGGPVSAAFGFSPLVRPLDQLLRVLNHSLEMCFLVQLLQVCKQLEGCLKLFSNRYLLFFFTAVVLYCTITKETMEKKIAALNQFATSIPPTLYSFIHNQLVTFIPCTLNSFIKNQLITSIPCTLYSFIHFFHK